MDIYIEIYDLFGNIAFHYLGRIFYSKRQYRVIFDAKSDFTT